MRLCYFTTYMLIADSIFHNRTTSSMAKVQKLREYLPNIKFLTMGDPVFERLLNLYFEPVFVANLIWVLSYWCFEFFIRTRLLKIWRLIRFQKIWILHTEIRGVTKVVPWERIQVTPSGRKSLNQKINPTKLWLIIIFLHLWQKFQISNSNTASVQSTLRAIHLI